LSVDDVKVYAAVPVKPSDAFPNASKWYESVASQLAKRFVLFSEFCNNRFRFGFVY